MNREQLRMELIYSLPSKRMIEVTNNLAVENPLTKELIYLKQRPRYEDTALSEYVRYSSVKDPNHDYREILAKSVIVNYSLLSRRGKEALLNM